MLATTQLQQRQVLQGFPGFAVRLLVLYLVERVCGEGLQLCHWVQHCLTLNYALIAESLAQVPQNFEAQNGQPRLLLVGRAWPLAVGLFGAADRLPAAG
mmetsp:Transcript_66388/g.167325  ORF Transcript_66388/g.167325 Transcript_66388/m.167325 type:complete len:99 (+) Transcript_66388:1662-1958(+)